MSLPHDHPLLLAARAGQIDHLRELLAQDNCGDQVTFSRIATEAAQYERIGVLDTLVDQSWIIDSTDSHNTVSLHHALRRNKAQLVTWLLLKGTDPNNSDTADSRLEKRQTATPLTIAAKYCSLNTMEELISHGARIEESEALSAAATSQTPDRIEKLAFLINRGVNVNEMQLVLPEHTSNGYRSARGTALHAACKWGFQDSEALLLEHGANPKLENSQKQSIEELKKLPPSLVGRGWSAPQVSAATRRRLGEERQKGREAEITKAQA